jgi:hypothetical protein
MTVHSPHLEILEDGLNSECLRCADLADHPDQLDAGNVARLRAGHLYTDLDHRAAEKLAAWDRRWSA